MRESGALINGDFCPPPSFSFPKQNLFSRPLFPREEKGSEDNARKRVRNGDECATYILIIIARLMPPHARLGTGRGRGGSEECRREEFLSGRFFDVDSPLPPQNNNYRDEKDEHKIYENRDILKDALRFLSRGSEAGNFYLHSLHSLLTRRIKLIKNSRRIVRVGVKKKLRYLILMCS